MQIDVMVVMIIGWRWLKIIIIKKGFLQLVNLQNDLMFGTFSFHFLPQASNNKKSGRLKEIGD
jgi:hypothetical protein